MLRVAEHYSLLLGLERLLAEETAEARSTAPSSTTTRSTRSPGTLAAIVTEARGHRRPAARANGRQRRRANGRAPPAEGSNGNGDGGRARRRRATCSSPTTRSPRTGTEPEAEDEEVVAEAPEDPGAGRRFWFEHATGAGKTVAAVGFIEASRTGGILILTHRRNLVDQFIGEISDRGYKERLSPPLLDGADHPYGPVTVETYQWFVRNAGRVSDAYSIVICDEAHTALGEKTSACIRNWTGPGVHRHDRDRRADRPPRRRPLPHPDLAASTSPRRRGAA